MKKILLPVSLLLTLVSSNAFAAHAYRSEVCKSTTHDLVYNGNYPIGGLYGISLVDLNQNISALPTYDTEDAPYSLEDADVIFSTPSSKIIERSEVTSDCGFEHEEWKSETTIEISLISADAAKKLGLKQGDKITFICEESTDYPDGSECK